MPMQPQQLAHRSMPTQPAHSAQHSQTGQSQTQSRPQPASVTRQVLQQRNQKGEHENKIGWRDEDGGLERAAENLAETAACWARITHQSHVRGCAPAVAAAFASTMSFGMAVAAARAAIAASTFTAARIAFVHQKPQD